MHQDDTQQREEIIIQMDRGVFWSILALLAIFTCTGIIGALVLVQLYL